MGRKSKKIPLATGLVGHKARAIHGQLEVSLINYDTVHITLWRNAYSGLSNVRFSVADTDLQDIINTLNEAKNKADSYWLAKFAAQSQHKR